MRKIALLKKELDNFLDEIRRCTHCFETPPGHTPFVYGTTDADVLVVSEMPSKTAWKNNIGYIWRTDLFANRKKGAPHTLIKWLKIKPGEANTRFFWLQRANCYVNPGKEYAYQHCSSRFISRAIDLVKPRLIIALGGNAAQYFLRFDKLTKVVGKNLEYTQNGNAYPVVAFFHPSWRADKFRNSEHEAAVILVKRKLAKA